MFDDLAKTLNELKTKRVKYYTILNYNLDNARSDEPLFIAGAYIYVLILDGTAKIKLNEIANDSIDLFKYRQIGSPFYRIFLTHAAQIGKTLTIAIGVGSDVFSLQDFQSPDLSLMSGYILDLKNSYAYNYGTQVAKSNSANNNTVIIHTVGVGKVFLLENWSCSCEVFNLAATGFLKVRDDLDVDQYVLGSLIVTGGTVPPSFGRGLISIPAGYDICVVSGSVGTVIAGFVKGREI